MSNEVEESKKEGNRCVEEKKFIEAMIHYTKAIKLSPKDSKLYSNRSLAFLRMQQHYHALDDALSCIKLEPSWSKGYFRKGEVEYDTGHFMEAMESYEEGLTKDPKNKEMADAAAKATIQWKKQTKSENRMPWYGGGVGLILSILLIYMDESTEGDAYIAGDVMKFLIAFAATAIGFGIMFAYTVLMQSQRCSLLEPPVDLFPAMGLSNNNDDDESNRRPSGSTSSKSSSSSPASSTTTRQRSKKSKS